MNLLVDRPLSLMPLSPDMAADLFEAIEENRVHLSRWLDWIERLTGQTDVDQFIDEAIGRTRRGQLTMSLMVDEKLVGLISHQAIQAETKSVQIGYWLIASAQGQGAMTRAARWFVAHTFETMDIDRVEIRVARENTRSQRVPERLGFKLERCEPAGDCVRGKLLDVNIFAMTSGDWKIRNLG